VFNADGAGSDHDKGEFDLGASEAAEPLAKKRVAFKDDLVDDAEIGNQRSVGQAVPPPRRSLSASPQSPPHDDLSATPAATSPPPRANRFGPRGRPGGVGAAGRRPLAR